MNIIDFDLTGSVNYKLNRFITSPDCVNKVRSTLYSRLRNKASCFQLSFGEDFAEFESLLNALNKFKLFNNLFILKYGLNSIKEDESIMKMILDKIKENPNRKFIYYLDRPELYTKEDFSEFYALDKFIPKEKYGKDSDKLKLLPKEFVDKLPIGKHNSNIGFIYIPSNTINLIFRNYIKANSDGYNLCRFMKATFNPMKLLPILMEVTYENSGFSK